MNEALKNPTHSGRESMNEEPLHEGSPMTGCQQGSPTLTATTSWHQTPADGWVNTTVAPALVFEPQGSEWDRMETLAPTPRPMRREASGGNVAPPRDILNDIKAERGLLGAVLLAPSCAEAQAAVDAAGIEPDMFQDYNSQEVWGLLNDLMAEGDTPNEVNLESVLKRSRIPLIALRDFVAGLPDETGGFTSLDTYAETLKGLRARREGVAICDKAKAELLNLRGSVAEAQEWLGEFSELSLVRKPASTNPWIGLVEDGTEMLARTLPPQVVIVEGIICEKSKLLIGGGSKSFKSWLTIHLAACIATGTPFIGRKCLRRRVLYVNLELKPDTFIRRLKAITPALDIELDPGWFHHLPLRGKMAGISPSAFVSWIIETAKSKGCEVVVADPLYKLQSGGDENSAGDQTLLVNELDRLTTDAGATVILNDHFGKGNQSEKDPLDAVRGSSAKGGDVDAAMILRKHDIADSFRVDMVHRELAGVDPFVIGWEYPLMRLRDDLDPDKMKQVKGGRKGQDPLKLLALIKETTREAGVSISEWAIRANIDRKTLREYLEQMRLDGWIATSGEGESGSKFITKKGLELLK